MCETASRPMGFRDRSDPAQDRLGQSGLGRHLGQRGAGDLSPLTDDASDTSGERIEVHDGADPPSTIMDTRQLC